MSWKMVDILKPDKGEKYRCLYTNKIDKNNIYWTKETPPPPQNPGIQNLH